MRFINCSYRKKLPEGGGMRQTAISSPRLPALSNQLKPQCMWKRSLFHLRAVLLQGEAELAGAHRRWVQPGLDRGCCILRGTWDQHRPSVLSFPNLSFPSSPLNRQSSAASQAQEVISLDWNQTSVPVPTAVPKHHRAAQAHPERDTPSICHFCLPPACKGLQILSPSDCN